MWHLCEERVLLSDLRIRPEYWNGEQSSQQHKALRLTELVKQDKSCLQEGKRELAESLNWSFFFLVLTETSLASSGRLNSPTTLSAATGEI
ncbi:hypothetical protein JRQ81_006854 [Phrynocephalus forsythii]|uniref:Uncharacterized protein n=1 Tax=Phrynocephalus forsythii TaxID=171643 RepID=A0A9Q1B6I7_9SAUR|nr:hypothetical protein JRQ81_006854 [Phrynocephalus forsythii]